jgi:outer membrane lipoprotein-sorting protein
MSNAQRWIFGTVVVLLVIVGFVANGLYIQTAKQLAATQAQLAMMQAHPTIEATSSTEQTTEPLPDDSAAEKNMLARVANLLPEGANIEHTLTLANGLTLVGSEPSFDGGSETKSLTLWLADTANGTIRSLDTIDTTGPGITVSFERIDYPAVAVVRILSQWEGYDVHTTDYVSMDTGKLLLRQTYDAGQLLELKRNGKTLTLQFAPADGCKNVTNETTRVNITGLLANGTELKFKKPYPVTCGYSELVGMGYFPNIDEVSFDGQATAQGANNAYLRTELGKIYATIDVDKLDASGISITE